MIDFNSSSYLELSSKEKLQLAVQEFNLCQESFEYYVSNYAYIRHPNAGIIKMNPFDFQLDVAIPISMVLKHRRSQKSIEELKRYQFKFDYEKWWNKIAEENIELSKKVPADFHEFWKITCQHEDYPHRVDTIILKSRQTGLSTIFQQLGAWHINFFTNVSDLILSKTDREAKKFLKDLVTSWEFIPGPIRSKRLNKNEHELRLSVTGQTAQESYMQVLPPTEDAGRSFDPNLVVLDEFSTYRSAEEVWTAVSMSVSAGGIIVIIATPKGVGNLYHKIWTATKKSLTVTIKNNPLYTLDEDEKDLSVFRPMVVHWSQLPEDEFKRRGFDDPLAWYRHMRAKLSMKGGEKLVAQELDLNFSASGNTIPANIIDTLKSNALEVKTKPIVVEDQALQGLVVYEKPNPNYEYLLGVDTAEGVHEDFSSFHVLKLPNAELLSQGGNLIPTVAAHFSSNSIGIKSFKDLVKYTGLLYNKAWLNIERNNHGHVLLTYFIQDNDYIADRILNKYDVNKNTFVKGTKGWLTGPGSRGVLIRMFLDFITEHYEHLSLPLVTTEQFLTFVKNNSGRWEAQRGYHDDEILSLALAVVGYQILPIYKQWLVENSSSEVPSIDLDEDMFVFSSNFLPEDKIQLKKENKSLIPSSEVDLDKIRSKLGVKSRKLKEQEDSKFEHSYSFRPLSSVQELEEDDVFIFGA